MRTASRILGAFLVSCSSSSTTATDAGGAGSDTGTPSDGGAETATDARLDVGDADQLNGCTAAIFSSNDHTAAADPRRITFPSGPVPDQFTPQCMTIRAGQSVTWTGAFESHPFAPFGGATATPIPSTSSGTTLSVAFPNPGEYGFHCEFHPEVMAGAVLVLR
jgi:plastocyanin